MLVLQLSAQAAPTREELERALSGYESVPDKETLARLGPEVEERLQEVVRHPSQRTLARVRALVALRFFPSPGTEAILLSVIRQGGKTPLELLLLEPSLTSYAAIKGPTSLTVIKPFLGHENRDVRYVAVQAIAASRSPQALGVLERWRKMEKTPMVLRELDRQLKHLRKASASSGNKK
jgi:hypothetical protein